LLISFVIPTYNYGRYIIRCLQSIVDQESGDYEIIVVDDGSTDNTRSIIAEISKKFLPGQLRYVYQENSGPSAARNNGAFQAQGKYVWFIDADDRLVPDALKMVREAVKKNSEVDFIFGGHVYIDDRGREIVREASFVGEDRNINFERFIKKKVHGISIGSLVVRKSVFERLSFSEGVHNNEDGIFFGHLLASCRGQTLSGILVEKIGHKDSLRNDAGAIKGSGVTVDRLFDNKILNREQMAFKNIYLSNNYFSLFRIHLRERELNIALRYYFMSVRSYPIHLFKWRRFKKFVGCLAKISLA
jgi:glycosyltransferase involved in cell wall biosynthesis